MRPGLLLQLSFRFLFGRGNDQGSRNYTLRRVRGGILGIALSLIPLLVVYVVANGMISGITLRFLETGSYHIQVSARMPVELEDLVSLGRSLRRIEGVRSAWPEVQGLGLLAGGLGHNGVQIRGVDPGLYQGDEGFSRYMEVIDGEFDLSEPRSILIGENMASLLEIETGDQVRIVTTPSGNTGPSLPRVSRFTVRGIVSSGYRELDSLWVFMSSSDAIRVIPPGEARMFVGLKIDDPFSLGDDAASLNFVTEREGNDDSFSRAQNPDNSEMQIIENIRAEIGSSWRLLTWFDLERSQYMSFITTRNLLLFIMVLIVLVAAVNISSTMIMLVLEKQEEVAILKAMGLENRSVILVYLISGSFTGFLGTLIGLALGALAAFQVNRIIAIIESVINRIGLIGAGLRGTDSGFVPLELFNPDFYLSSIPVQLGLGELILIGLLSVTLSLIMSVIPAFRAVRHSPLNMLHRH